MDEIIDIKSFELLKRLNNSELRKVIRLLSVFGNNGSEVILVTKEDYVYCFGDNKSGSLGLGTYQQPISQPVINKTLSGKGLVDIISGLNHCFGLTTDGKCYAWGHNGYGRLGIGTHDMSATPQLIKELDSKCIVQIACGTAHTIALTKDGKLYSWGRNNWGQLGLHHFKSRYFPNLIEIPNKIVMISCGTNHSLALTETRQVYIWGINDFGQLGIHRNCVNRTDREKSSLSKLQILNNFSKAFSVVKVVCGPNHSLLLTCEGSIYSFGENSCGQLGIGQSEKKFNPCPVDAKGIKFKDIIANNQNDLSMALSEDNKCYIWGHIKNINIWSPKTSSDFCGLSMFDIYAKYANFKITFKTIVINEDNIPLNANNSQSVMKTNEKSSQKSVGTVEQQNRLLRKSSDNSKNAVNGNAVNFMDHVLSDDQNNNNLAKNQSKDLMNFETISIESINSDNFMSCITTLSKAKLENKFNKLLSQSFDRQEFSDLEFVFDDQNVIYCHKTILMIRNQKFWQNCSKHLINGFKENTKIGFEQQFKQKISIKAYSYKTFYSFVQYLYGFEPDLDIQMIDSLIKLANFYEEPELTDLCYHYMKETEESFNLLNICTLYEKAVNNCLTDLEMFCIEFVAKNWKIICKSDAFQALNDSLSERLMIEIFSKKMNSK